MADFTITITVPEAKALALSAAFNSVFKDRDLAGEETKEAFFKRKLREYIQKVYKKSTMASVDAFAVTVRAQADTFTEDITVT